MRTRPVIWHLDLDAFFSAVEQLHKPSLRGKPVVVGGIGRRGVVSTASYEARAFGIGSAMPVAEARRRCPNAAYLSPRFHAYRAASEVVMGLLRELSPLLEQVSVDEAYLDLAATRPELSVEEAVELAQDVRARVHDVTGLTASIGVSTSKLVSKIGSELAKPDGLLVIPPGEEAATLAPLQIRRLPGVGPATAERLRRRRIATIGELADLAADEAIDLLGQAHGTALHRFAQGIDPRPVVPERDAKSISAEETFPVDQTDPRLLRQQLEHLVGRVCARLANDGSYARTVTLKLRRHDFTTLTRSLTLDRPTDAASTVLTHATHLLAAIDVSDGVRLLGVGVSGLTDYAQQDLLAELAELAELDAAAPLDVEVPDADGSTATDSAGQPTREPASESTREPTLGPSELRVWSPGQDVAHDERGPGWVQGSGLGRVTVRFEGPHTPPGPIATFAVDDPALSPADPPVWQPRGDHALGG